MEPQTPLVLREDLDGIVRLTLNHPQRRNALSRAMLTQLREHLLAIEADRSLRVVILKAHGPTFSSGHDLRELAASSPTELRAIFELSAEVMQTFPSLPQPTIAEVHALATAAGCQLAASCDLIVAATTASFSTPGVKIGLFCTTPSVPLSEALPPKKTLEMLLTGQPLSASDAERFGLVNQVVAPQELAEHTLALARSIAVASPTVLATGKRNFYRLLGLGRQAAYQLATPIMAEQAAALAGREGMAAFLEKRPPVWPE
jgi:enoyl-CoA hydratase/carnithine racemase